jgi:hypothetical protein
VTNENQITPKNVIRSVASTIAYALLKLPLR